LAVTRRVIEEAAERGPVVVVGRGAQLMLGRRDDALHVLCYAPREALVARAARRMNASPEEAARVVDDTNRQREQYVQRHWGRSWRAHENYHLCVNTDWLGVAGAAETVVETARRRFGG
jgi:cytidylate kinase